MNPFLAAIFLSTLNTKLVDLIKQPILQRWPDADLWWFAYVSIVTGLVMTWYAQLNLLADYIPDVTVARILTGLSIGAGSWFLYEVFVDTPSSSIKVETTRQEESRGDSLTQVSVREGDGDANTTQ